MSEQIQILAIHVNEDMELLCRSGDWRHVTEIRQLREGCWIECGEGHSEYYALDDVVTIR